MLYQTLYSIFKNDNARALKLFRLYLVLTETDALCEDKFDNDDDEMFSRLYISTPYISISSHSTHKYDNYISNTPRKSYGRVILDKEIPFCERRSVCN